MENFQDEIYSFIINEENENGIRLSDEAKQLLILPLLEIETIAGRYYGNEYTVDNWRASIKKLFENLKNEPARFDLNYRNGNERTSISVIKAFADKFCNIPPFCGER